jgi:hypothetical protein
MEIIEQCNYAQNKKERQFLQEIQKKSFNEVKRDIIEVTNRIKVNKILFEKYDEMNKTIAEKKKVLSELQKLKKIKYLLHNVAVNKINSKILTNEIKYHEDKVKFNGSIINKKFWDKKNQELKEEKNQYETYIFEKDLTDNNFKKIVQDVFNDDVNAIKIKMKLLHDNIVKNYMQLSEDTLLESEYVDLIEKQDKLDQTMIMINKIKSQKTVKESKTNQPKDIKYFYSNTNPEEASFQIAAR